MGNVDFHAFNLRIEIGRLQEKNASLQAENERLKREKILWQQNTVDMAEKINALQSKIDRVKDMMTDIKNALCPHDSIDDLNDQDVLTFYKEVHRDIVNEILDLLK